jgi:putative membrane protein
MQKTETRPIGTPPNIDSLLMDSDRTLMMIVNTSLTLIGFGFTINEVFGKAAGHRTLVHGNLLGQLLGIALLVLGLLLLGLGIRGHASLVGHLTGHLERPFRRRQSGLPYRHYYSAVYSVAIMLLVIGSLTFGAVILGIVHDWLQPDDA